MHWTQKRKHDAMTLAHLVRAYGELCCVEIEANAVKRDDIERQAISLKMTVAELYTRLTGFDIALADELHPPLIRREGSR